MICRRYSMKKTCFAQLILVLYVAAVVYVCFGHIDSDQMPLRSLFGLEADKLVHGVLFLPFSILVYYSFGSRSANVFESVGIALGLFIVGAAAAAATEYFQGFTTYRQSDIHDFYADMVGLGVSSLFVMAADISRHVKKRGRR